jgi:hypothetical protein
MAKNKEVKLDKLTIAFRTHVRETAPKLLAGLLSINRHSTNSAVWEAIDAAETLAQELNVKGYLLFDDEPSAGAADGREVN